MTVNLGHRFLKLVIFGYRCGVSPVSCMRNTTREFLQLNEPFCSLYIFLQIIMGLEGDIGAAFEHRFCLELMHSDRILCGIFAIYGRGTQTRATN